MKKAVVKVTSICLLSAMMIGGNDFAVLAQSQPIGVAGAGITLALNQFYENVALQSDTNKLELTQLSTKTVTEPNTNQSSKLDNSQSSQPEKAKQVTPVISGYTNLGVANVNNYLNIRKEAGEDKEVVGKLPQNAGCEILSRDGEWFQIKSGKVTGYVKAEYLLTGEAANAKAEEVKTAVATVNTTTLKVRVEPNKEAKVITLIPIEEELEVLEDQGEWIKVTVDSDEGYISKEFVDISYSLPKAVSMTELKYGDGVSDSRVSIVEYAKQFLGNPYVWGGTSLTNGTDCSGFVMQLLKKYGVSLPHSSAAQSRMGTAVDYSNLLPGDLLFYGKNGHVSHVTMYIGGGKVIHASSKKTGIKISNAFYRTPICARRFIK